MAWATRRGVTQSPMAHPSVSGRGEDVRTPTRTRQSGVHGMAKVGAVDRDGHRTVLGHVDSRERHHLESGSPQPLGQLCPGVRGDGRRPGGAGGGDGHLFGPTGEGHLHRADRRPPAEPVVDDKRTSWCQGGVQEECFRGDLQPGRRTWRTLLRAGGPDDLPVEVTGLHGGAEPKLHTGSADLTLVEVQQPAPARSGTGGLGRDQLATDPFGALHEHHVEIRSCEPQRDRRFQPRRTGAHHRDVS